MFFNNMENKVETIQYKCRNIYTKAIERIKNTEDIDEQLKIMGTIKQYNDVYALAYYLFNSRCSVYDYNFLDEHKFILRITCNNFNHMNDKLQEIANIIYDKDYMYEVNIIVRIDNMFEIGKTYTTETLIINKQEKTFDDNGKLIDFTFKKVREIPFTSYSDYRFMRLENTILNDLFIFDPNIERDPKKEENIFKFEDHNVWTFDKICESIKNIDYDYQGEEIIAPILKKVNETKDFDEQLKLMKYICLYYHTGSVCDETYIKQYCSVFLPYEISGRIKIENNLLALRLDIKDNKELRENLFKHLGIIDNGNFGNWCYITFSKNKLDEYYTEKLYIINDKDRINSNGEFIYDTKIIKEIPVNYKADMFCYLCRDILKDLCDIDII